MAQGPVPLATPPPPKTVLIQSSPGIIRDGTLLAQTSYIDGLWCRFWQARPRKMLGYREQIRNFGAIPRQLNVFCDNGFAYVHGGTFNSLERYSIQIIGGTTTGIVDRTPAGFTPNAQNLWQMTVMYNTTGATTQLYAVATPSLTDISSSTEAQVYGGDVSGTGALTALSDTGTGAKGPITASGGVVAVAGQYLFTYGATGLVTWNVPGFPTNRSDSGSGASRPCASKIVRGMELRGSSAPSAIFWSLDSVIIGNFVGGATFWNFTNLTTSGSILSANGVIEHNGIYYWATTNGFCVFNGVVRDVPNAFNKQYFLDNLNFSQRQKVFAYKVPRWNEIWWCFPFGNATECNHAVIYDYSQNIWYDTPLPNGGRAAGYSDLIFNYPIMAGVDLNSDTSGYSVWQHEVGYDEISGAQQQSKAIRSFYETNEFSFAIPQQPGAPGESRAMSFMRLEPDWDQVGDLLFTPIARQNARASDKEPAGSIIVPGLVITPQDETTKFKLTGRLTRFRIESNVLGGYYEHGSPVVHFLPSDARVES